MSPHLSEGATVAGVVVQVRRLFNAIFKGSALIFGNESGDSLGGDPRSLKIVLFCHFFDRVSRRFIFVMNIVKGQRFFVNAIVILCSFDFRYLFSIAGLSLRLKVLRFGHLLT